MSEMVTVMIAGLICVISIIGCFFNALSVYIYSRPYIKSPVSILFVGLSITDLVLLFLAMVVFVPPGLNIRLQSDFIIDFGEYAAVLLYPLVMVAQTSSIWILVTITVERYIAVCFPFRVMRYCSEKRSKQALLAIWLGAAAYNAVRFWEYQLPQFDSTTNLTSMRNLRSNHFYIIFYYTSMYLITHFCIPLMIILVLSLLIARKIARVRKKRQTLTSQESDEHNIAIMLMVVIVVFFIGNVLLLALNVVESLDPYFFDSDKTRNIAYFLNDLANLLVVLNCSSTWIIYLAFCKKYRDLFRHVFYRFVFGRKRSEEYFALTVQPKKRLSYSFYTQAGHHGSITKDTDTDAERARVRSFTREQKPLYSPPIRKTSSYCDIEQLVEITFRSSQYYNPSQSSTTYLKP